MIKRIRGNGFLKWTYVFVFLVFISFSASLSAELIKNPKPTHFEKKYTPLELLTTIGDDDDDDVFLVRPTSLVVDDDGNLYVYDAMFKKIFKYDRDLQFVKFIGAQGRGPGEIHGGNWEMQKLYYGLDKNIYVSDLYNRKIIVFSREGVLIKEMRIHPAILDEFSPVLDKEGNYYAYMNNNGVIEKISPDDRVLKSYLTDAHMERFVLFEPKAPKHRLARRFWTGPSVQNTFYYILPDNRLFIYITNSSTMYLFKNDRLTAQYDLWPENAMKTSKYWMNEEEEIQAKNNKKFEKYIPMFYFVFIDQDRANTFYFVGNKEENGKAPIYSFNDEGKLLEVFYTDTLIAFHAKKNHRFYGVQLGKVFIYEEVKK